MEERRGSCCPVLGVGWAVGCAGMWGVTPGSVLEVSVELPGSKLSNLGTLPWTRGFIKPQVPLGHFFSASAAGVLRWSLAGGLGGDPQGWGLCAGTGVSPAQPGAALLLGVWAFSTVLQIALLSPKQCCFGPLQSKCKASSAICKAVPEAALGGGSRVPLPSHRVLWRKGKEAFK